MIPKKISFEHKIISILAVVLLLLCVVGVYTVQNLKGIVVDVNEAVKPNKKIDILKQVIPDIIEAENSIKTYRITKDESYLIPFYNSISSIDDKIVTLRSQSSGEVYQEKLADTVKLLIKRKYFIFNQFLQLEEDEVVTKNIAKIEAELEKASNNISLGDENEATIFQSIFGKDKKDTGLLNLFSYNAIDNLLENSVSQDLQINQLIKQKELYLAKEDRLVTDKIRLALLKMESFERTSDAKKALKVSKTAKNTKFYIIFLCVIAILLLAFISYLILVYVNKNKAYRKALRKAKKQAEDLAKAKESFLANMSHEIRTPLNAIIGFTNQLLETKVTQNQKEQLLIVKKSSDHLLQIINDILDYSKMSSGKLVLEEVGFSPAEILEEVELLMQPALKNKELSIKREVNKTVPKVCLGDPVRFRQIAINLVANAIKFTNTGKITLSLSAIQQSENQVSLRLIVKDTGVGISNEKLKVIFNEFEQADSSVSRKFGGTGLGLTISKRLTEIQGGSIDIKSEEGKGTEVSIIIPYKIGAEKDIASVLNESVETNALKGYSVLVADDEEYNRLLIKKILEKWGINVTLVVNGKEATNAVEKNNYAAILMDVLMPIMGGIEATKTILKKIPSIPIIGLTADGRAQNAKACKVAGMRRVLPKPFDEIALYKILVEVITNTSVTVDEATKVRQIDEPKHYSLDDLNSLANGDKAFVVEMVEVFIKSTQESVAAIRESFENENWEAVADSAHKAAPPCRHMQANQLLAKLKQLETLIRDENNTQGVEAIINDIKREADFVIEELQKEIKNL